MKPAFVLLLLLLMFQLHAQPVDERRILQMISDPDPHSMAANDSVLLTLYQKGSDDTRKTLYYFFSRNTYSSNHYTAARSLLWKAVISCRPPYHNIAEGNAAMQQAVNRAVESGDAYLMLQCFEQYAYQCVWTGKQETALFYFLKSGDIRKQLGDELLFFKNLSFYGSTGDLLFQMQEYAQAIPYFETGVSLPGAGKYPHTSALNTLALCFQRLGKVDSAMYWYNKSMESAKANNDTLWQAIIQGNIGALHFDNGEDDKALPLLWKDYSACLQKEPNNAANTLHRIALIYLRRQKTDSALLLARRAMIVLTNTYPGNPGFLRNASKALAEVYRKLGNADSAFYYADRYHYLNDSINLVVARNRVDVVQARLDFEKTSNNINVLLREKQSEKTRRNLLLLGIGLLAVAGWFYFRWQKQQLLNREMQLLHEKEKIETEIQNSKAQLQEFTQHLIDKNELIEQLQQQLQQQGKELHDDLQNQSILTESDWLRFKDMFEKAHPGFMLQLQSAAPGITTAELRLAALVKLNLGNKHMAAMLGIGADAIRKTRSRLRQRLQLSQEDDLEQYIKSIKTAYLP